MARARCFGRGRPHRIQRTHCSAPGPGHEHTGNSGGCPATAPAGPDGAWDLHDEWEDLLVTLYGKPRFYHFPDTEK
jgi:hypothetical protein